MDIVYQVFFQVKSYCFFPTELLNCRTSAHFLRVYKFGLIRQTVSSLKVTSDNDGHKLKTLFFKGLRSYHTFITF